MFKFFFEDKQESFNEYKLSVLSSQKKNQTLSVFSPNTDATKNLSAFEITNNSQIRHQSLSCTSNIEYFNLLMTNLPKNVFDGLSKNEQKHIVQVLNTSSQYYLPQNSRRFVYCNIKNLTI